MNEQKTHKRTIYKRKINEQRSVSIISIKTFSSIFLNLHNSFKMVQIIGFFEPRAVNLNKFQDKLLMERFKKKKTQTRKSIKIVSKSPSDFYSGTD